MRKLLPVFLFLSALPEAFAQEEGGAVKINVFQPDGAKIEEKKDLPKYQNMIKWNWSVMSRGVFLLNYELVLTPKLSAEAGLGLTYRDWIYEVLKNEVFLNYREAKANFCGELSLRFYPKEHHNFEGIYLSPTASYRKYSFGNQKDYFSNYVGYNSTFYPSYSFLDIQVKFGYQYESMWDWDVMTDFYLGFAYRTVTAKYYEESAISQNGYSSYSPRTKTESYPQPILGFKMGMPF